MTALIDAAICFTIGILLCQLAWWLLTDDDEPETWRQSYIGEMDPADWPREGKP